ncbi:hypothetical protein Q9L58_009466 [Maublancomyces gigas]|uniref:Uncharacterized protein n=1 Tax=Discina gigas TaxID=1032678 RepID=A0ABR3G6U9_9PEZI
MLYGEMPSGVVSCTEKFEEEEAREKELEELELVVDVLHVVSQVSSEVAGGLTTIVAARTITLQNKTKMRCARRCGESYLAFGSLIFCLQKMTKYVPRQL